VFDIRITAYRSHVGVFYISSSILIICPSTDLALLLTLLMPHKLTFRTYEHNTAELSASSAPTINPWARVHNTSRVRYRCSTAAASRGKASLLIHCKLPIGPTCRTIRSFWSTCFEHSDRLFSTDSMLSQAKCMSTDTTQLYPTASWVELS